MYISAGEPPTATLGVPQYFDGVPRRVLGVGRRVPLQFLQKKTQSRDDFGGLFPGNVATEIGHGILSPTLFYPYIIVTSGLGSSPKFPDPYEIPSSVKRPFQQKVRRKGKRRISVVKSSATVRGGNRPRNFLFFANNLLIVLRVNINNCLKKNLNASKPCEHPPPGEKCLKASVGTLAVETKLLHGIKRVPQCKQPYRVNSIINY